MDRNKVVLVDENDQALGEMEKLEAHLKGQLHRAFSVFIFNDKGELLLQQRAANKYHGAGLWTNSCCSHPQLEEDVKASAVDRLKYEMGLTCDLKFLFSFIYHTEVENNLIEHEFDHVFIGFSNINPKLNRKEVQDFKWIPVKEILEDIKLNPQVYTYWFKSALSKVTEYIDEMHDSGAHKE